MCGTPEHSLHSAAGMFKSFLAQLKRRFAATPPSPSTSRGSSGRPRRHSHSAGVPPGIPRGHPGRRDLRRTTSSPAAAAAFYSTTAGRTRLISRGPSTRITPLPSTPRLICKHCDRVFHSYGAFDFHVAHYAHGARGHSCGVCERVVDNRSELVRHMKHYHPKRPFFACPHCDRVYRSASMVKRHVARRHGRGHCYRCRFVGQSRRKMDEHYNDYHLKCRFCGKRFEFSWWHEQQCTQRRYGKTERHHRHNLGGEHRVRKRNR